MAWLTLLSTLHVLVLPLANATSAKPSSAYATWLGNQASLDGQPGLQVALDEAAGERHRSLESFVRDFVRSLPGDADVVAAGLAFGERIETADQLLALILKDLRSLSPREPLADARVRSAENTALSASVRAVLEARERARAPGHTLEAPAAPSAPEFQASFGLLSSIQALGP
ncbi:MAG: hypothetical protein JJ896_16635 [Rhodothermales bacterium]|nr:hypothetical protein [Rhodothermales bacterium]MBO6781285.1 hypothetical protein [Rhodothermales bacterium]